MEYLNFDSVIPSGRYEGMTVREAFNKNNKSIFSMIKRCDFQFSDDVLEEAHIKKIVRDRKVYTEFEHHEDTSKKKLKKDTKTIDQILDEMDFSRTDKILKDNNENLDSEENDGEEE